jgi:hypothetical protein
MRSKLIVCAPVMEELAPLLSPEMEEPTVREFGLHEHPEKLHTALQEEIEQAEREGVDTVVFGYGMCSKGTLGLRSSSCRLVVPRVDDCIGLFLTSKGYKEQIYREAGTFFLTKGWMETEESLFSANGRFSKRYDARTRDLLIRTLFKNYTRLALIDTGNYPIDGYRSYLEKQAQRYGLRYEEIPGTNTLMRKLVSGKWDDDFIVVEPGQEITFDMFFPEE